MSVETPGSAAESSVSGVSHGGPVVPWETVLATCEAPISRGELAGELVDRGHAPARPAGVDMVDAAISRGELAYDGAVVVAASRQSNRNKSVNSATAESPASENTGQDKEALIEEKAREFATEYPLRVTQPLAERDGIKIRREYAEIETESWVENQPDTPQFELQNPAKGESVVDVSAVEWGEAIREFLESHRVTENTEINLRKGRPGDPEFGEFSIDAENRWMASYQKKFYGQLDAWLRELTGGERPSGGTTEPTYENPHVALITRSASSMPNGQRVGPVDHAQHLRGSWESVYHTLRNTLRSEGYELGESWQYDRRLEPHTGKRGNDRGLNEAYAHEHIILVVDGEVSAGDLRPVIEKHVEECEWAGEEAHGEEAIEVREPDELNDVAAYVADYCSIDPVELWERGPAYIGWAAAMTAGNIRTVSRSETARQAAKADMCKQRYESDESEQSQNHGENVRRDLNTGGIVCSECGSPHGINQGQTLVEARRPATSDSPAVVSDGGIEVSDREVNLRGRWQDADAAAVVGEAPKRTKQREAVSEWLETDVSVGEFWATNSVDIEPPDDLDELVAEIEHPEFDVSEPAGFEEYVPEWHVHSVTVEGEEKRASAGNGVDMVEIQNDEQRISESVEFGDGRKFRCGCGVSFMRRVEIVRHMMDGHGIGEVGRIEDAVTVELGES